MGIEVISIKLFLTSFPKLNRNKPNTMQKYWITKLFSHAAFPALVAIAVVGQTTDQHGFYHAKRDNLKSDAIRKAWEDSEDSWYHRPVSPGLHEVTGS
jgi:hypothetical protein